MAIYEFQLLFSEVRLYILMPPDLAPVLQIG